MSVSLNIIARMEKDHKLKQIGLTFSCTVKKLQKKLIMLFFPLREPLYIFLGDLLV